MMMGASAAVASRLLAAAFNPATIEELVDALPSMVGPRMAIPTASALLAADSGWIPVAGATVNGTLKQIHFYDPGTVSGVNFDGWSLSFRHTAGTVLEFVDCTFDETASGVPNPIQAGRMIDHRNGNTVRMRFCEIKGSYTGEGMSVLYKPVNTSSAAPSVIEFEFCKFHGFASDVIKPQAGYVVYSVFDAGITMPDVTPTEWNAGTAYVLDDWVVPAGKKPLYNANVFRAKGSLPPGTTLPANVSDANWEYRNPHADIITVPECSGGFSVQFCLLNSNAASRIYSAVTYRSNGLNNHIRIGGGADQFDLMDSVYVIGNKFLTYQDSDARPFQTAVSGITAPSEAEFRHNIIQPRLDGEYFYPTGNVLIWDTNKDLDGDALATPGGGAATETTTAPDIATVLADFNYRRAEADELTGTKMYAFMGQSNIEHLMARTGAFVSGANTYPSGVDNDNVRIVLGDGPTETIADFLVTDAVMVAKNINLGTAAIAEFLAWRYPAANFVLLDLAVVGTGRIELQNDADTDRQWSLFADLVDHVDTNYGKKPDVVFEFWTADDGAWIPSFGKNFAPLYFGEMWSGAAFTLGSQNTESSPTYTSPVDHCFWDDTAASLSDLGRGIFTRADTKLALSQPAVASSYEDGVCLESGFRAFQSDPRVQYFRQAADLTPGLQTGYHAGGHALVEPDGQVKLAQSMLMPAVLRHTGDFIKPPSVIGYEMGPANAYCDIIFDLPHGGNLTTIGALEGRAALSSSMPARQDVYGIRMLRTADTATGANQLAAGFPLWNTAETGQSVNYRGTAVIQDAGSGSAPSRTGRVRVTPTVAFATGDRLYAMQDEQIVTGDPSSLGTAESSFKPWTRYPIEHVPDLYNASAQWPFWGFTPLLWPEPYIVGATPPSAPADYWTQVSTGPRFTDTGNLPAGCSRVKWSARMRITDAGRQTGMASGEKTLLFQGGTYLDMVLRVDQSFFYMAVKALKDSAGTNMLTGGDVTVLRPFLLNRWIDVAVDIDMPAQTLTVSIDGAAVSTTALPANSGLFAVASNRRLSLNGSASAAMSAGVDFDFVQIETATTGGLTTRKLLSGPAATVNADGWKVVGSGDAI